MLRKLKEWIKNRKRVIAMTTTEAIKSANVTLIDVREPYELETDGVVPNAINIPLGEVPAKMDEIQQLDTPIVVFCRSGQRSATAAQFLQQNGVENIYNGGGFEDVLAVLEAK